MENGTTTLGAYLVRLGEDRDELTKFLKNPERAMREAGVPADHRDLIISGDIDRVHQVVQEQLGGETVAIIVHWNWPIVHT